MRSDQQIADELRRAYGISPCNDFDAVLSRTLSEVRQEEREACAKIAERINGRGCDVTFHADIAAAIRARKEGDTP